MVRLLACFLIRALPPPSLSKCHAEARCAAPRHPSHQVLTGDLAGQTGELVGTDGGDGIIKIAGDVKILSLASIGKYVPLAA